MKQYVLDANAVLRYFAVGEGGGGDKVRGLFEQAERGQAQLSMSAINLGEVFYILLRRVGEERALHYVQALRHAVTMVDADTKRTLEAARLKHQSKLGSADSFAAVLALELKATLVSADPAFETVGKGLRWMRLPKFEAKRR
jgi:predicted nucleic acid-binding protein